MQLQFINGTSDWCLPEGMDLELLLSCDICGDGHSTELCPELGLDHMAFQMHQLSTRARLTLPHNLEIVDSKDGQVTVVAKEHIARKTQMGPYEAKRTTHIFDDAGYFTLKVLASDGTNVCLDTTDENECNWLCLVQAATCLQQQNCIAYQLGPNIFYNTIRDIQPREELRVWYATNFARKLGKPTEPDNISRVLLGHRIEPLHHDMVVEETFLSPEDVFEDESAVEDPNSTEPPIAKDGSAAQSLPKGKIIKGVYCPRCGHTFATQAEMVQHLRVHVKAAISASNVNKRPPGRPRKHPLKESTPHSGVKKRGRGRPSVKGVVLYSKTISNKRERNSENGSSDEDDLDPDDDPDHEFSPQESCTVTPVRSNPRRSTRGKRSKLDSDYVYTLNTKEEKEDDLEGLDDEGDANEKDETAIHNKTSAVKTGAKRGRGRPRKVRADDQMVSEYTNEATVTDNATDGVEQENADSLNEVSHTYKNGVVGDRTLIVVNLEESKKSFGGNSEVFSIVVENGKHSYDASYGGGNVLEATKHENDHIAVGIKQTSVNIKDELDKNGLESFDTADDINNELSTGEVHKDTFKGQTADLADENTETPHNSVYKIEINIENSDNPTSSDQIEKSTGESNQNNITMMDDTQHLPSDNQPTLQSVDENYPTHKDSEDTGPESTDTQVEAIKEPEVTTADSESLVNMFEETGDNLFMCVLCDESFPTDASVNEHIMRHNEGDRGACKYCGTELSALRDVLEHRKDCKVLVVKFECDICQQAFKSAHYLYRHMVMHTDTFICRKCRKTFSRKDSLQKHVLKCCPAFAKDYKIHYCEVCHRVFSTAPGLSRHSEKCKSVGCSTCSKIFVTKDDLNIHKCHHTANKDESARYSCGQCSKCFQSMYYLQQHRLIHKNMHSCDKCGRNLANKDDLETHRLLCETLESIRLFGSGRCGQCEVEFSNGKAFREHHLSHTHQYQCDKCLKRFIKIGTLTNHDCQGASTEFVCSACKRGFKTSETLEKHVNEAECMNYACSACDQQFHLKSHGRDHMESCTGVFSPDDPPVLRKINEESFICQQCGKSFSTKSNLTKHILLHGDKQHKCPYCEKAFHLDIYLKEHLSGVHLNHFKYQCNDCGRMMKSKTGFNEHVRVFHTKNAQVYTCPECNKQFKQRGNLRSHMFSHSEERKFACDICLKSFKYPDQLSRHKLEHRSTVKFSCIICNKNFFRNTELKKHIELYHSGLVYVCGVCNARCGHRHTLVRHYKRKHPDQVGLLGQEGYVSSLHKHVSAVYDANEQKMGEEASDNINDGEQIVIDGMSLPREAAEALQNLALGTATQKHYDILKEKGLILQEQPQGTLNESNIIVPQDSYINPDHATVGSDHEGTISISTEQLESTFRVMHNPDGSFTVNGVPVLPQALQGPDGQIVILQIVDPGSQNTEQAILHAQMGSVPLSEEETLVSTSIHEDHEQVLTAEEEADTTDLSSSDGYQQVDIVSDVTHTEVDEEVVHYPKVTVSTSQAEIATLVTENEVLITE
ncbi:uncharacterized protein LOC127846353 isoform X3 [Dreissena polymorpha]|uniref:uncharacterized protein LOC127846353 isoform X3 n=1 Tax=Dreissena polymorpha TaxID=45954 RepID=UPI002264736F|nr:uncharacterized protein LOC127846353 isoform X3 [Dreissena polymorpha]